MGSERLVGTSGERARERSTATHSSTRVRDRNAILALQRSAGNQAVASALQRVNFDRGIRVDFSTTDAETAKRWVHELEAGDWKHASISHMQKLARRLAHLARQVEVSHGKDAAQELWAYKRRAEKAGRLTEIRESNTLDEKYSETKIGEVMEGHAALASGPRRDSQSDS